MWVCRGLVYPYLTTYFPEPFVNTYPSKNGKLKLMDVEKIILFKSITEFVLILRLIYGSVL